MYAIAISGGKQFKIEQKALVRVPSLQANVGDKVRLEEIIFLSDGEKIQFGSPVIEGAYAEAVVVRHGRNRKIRIIKYKRRKDYRRTLGHRQGFTEIEIGSIVLGKKTKESTVKKAEEKEIKAEAPSKPPVQETKVTEKPVKKAPAKTKDESSAKEVEKAPAAKKKAVAEVEEKKTAGKKPAKAGSKPKKTVAKKAGAKAEDEKKTGKAKAESGTKAKKETAAKAKSVKKSSGTTKKSSAGKKAEPAKSKASTKKKEEKA